jgi:hypothetical protein
MRLTAGRRALSMFTGVFAAAALVVAASLQATPVNLKGTIPLFLEVTSPCSGDLIAVAEELHWTGHLSDVDPDQRRLQLLHANAVNGTATNLTTGETYRFISTSTSAEVNPAGEQLVSMFIVRQQFVGLGTGDSFALVLHLLLVIDANGEVRASIQNEEFECIH